MNPFTSLRIYVDLPESRSIDFFSFLPEAEPKSNSELKNEDFGKTSSPNNPLQSKKFSYYQQTLQSLIQRVEYSGYLDDLTSSDNESITSLESLEDFIELSTQDSQFNTLSQQKLELEDSLKKGFHSIPRSSFENEIASHSIISQDNLLNIDALMNNFLDNARIAQLKKIPISTLEDFILNLKNWTKSGKIQTEAQVFKKIAEKLGIGQDYVQHLCKTNRNSRKSSILLDLKKKILALKSYLNEIQESKIKWNKIAENQLIEIEILIESFKGIHFEDTKENEKFDIELFKKLHLTDFYNRRLNFKMINLHSSYLNLDDNPTKGVKFEEIHEFPIDDFIAFDM